MFNDETPSYLAESPQLEVTQPSYMDFPPPMQSSIQPPTTQPSLQNSKINLPQVESPNQVLPYSYRAGVSPYFRNYPYKKVLGNLGQIGESIFPNISNSAFRDSSISGSFILGGAVLGYHYEKQICKKIGGQGYGAILGALGGSMMNNYLKAKGDNISPIQSLMGGLVPMLPLAFMGYRKKNMQGQTAYTVGSIAFAYLLYQRFMVK